ncbi:nitroreductase family protein [Maribacter sp. TH_r10]|uniref:nitroreductase family protein n=1 Tax=Maribacter sp. TH_r10 TaxID=3082086 RepID=UPI0029552962|nr:nitroreductase family protein [Maribacter sp. TH_r10]MDV7140197.1 nitroreductase family protein [Maribacter sp. TH_r10]
MNLYKKTRALLAMFKYFSYDIRRYFKHFNYINKKNSLDKFKGELIMNYHVIEKGLTMPETRLGFGQAAQVPNLIGLLEEYLSQGYSVKELEFVYSLKTLNEYLGFHKKHDFSIKEDLIRRIEALNEKCNIREQSKQCLYTEQEYFKNKDAAFDLFAITRHSVRNYSSKDIPEDIIAHCVKVAQKSPSSCNRQPIKVYAVKDEAKKIEILKLQSGNRGFGHLANTIFVITSNLSLFQNFPERNEPALNAGLFTMSFLYALHQQKIGACSLNWCVSVDGDRALRKLLEIPDNEQVHLVISSGYLPERLEVAASPRQTVDKVLKVIQ